MEDTIAGLLAGIIVFFFCCVFAGIILFIPVVGWHYETGRGEHTGYITAVETGGIFFKTSNAYLKTDTQSSQEDIYCVVDPTVLGKLKEFAKTKTFINVYYLDYIANGISTCGLGGSIIYDVSVASPTVK